MFAWGIASRMAGRSQHETYKRKFRHGTGAERCRFIGVPMLRPVYAAIFLCWALPAAAQPLAPYGDRFGNTSLVPANWTRLAPDPRWDGTRFMSPDGQAWLAIYAIPHKRSTAEQHMRELSEVRGERATYIRRGNGWFVASGLSGGRIYYRKAILVCGGRFWRHIELDYPAAMKRAYDFMVTRISHGFTARYERC
jgi:hypothetical protein